MPSITIAALIDRAQQLTSGVATDASLSPLIDSEFTLDVLVEHAINQVSRQWANDPVRRAQLKQEISLTFSSGVAAIPSNLLEDWTAEAVFHSEHHPPLRDLVSWQPHGRPVTRIPYLYYFWVDGTDIKLVDGQGTGFDGDVTLIAAKQPSFSAGSLTASSHFIEDTILCLAAVMRGEMPLATLIEGYTPPKKK